VLGAVLVAGLLTQSAPQLSPQTRRVLKHAALALRDQHAALQNLPALGPTVVTAWSSGNVIARVTDKTAQSAVSKAYRRFIRDPKVIAARDNQALTVTLEVALTQAPLVRSLGWLSSIGLVPLHDGLWLKGNRSSVFVTPLDLVVQRAYGQIHTPIPELRLGVDIDAVTKRSTIKQPRSIERVRFATITTAEYPQERRPQRVHLQRAARAAAMFLLRHQKPDGQFTYVYDGQHDRELPAGYNLPRHAGVIYFLAQAARLLPLPEGRSGALAGIHWLERHHLQRCADNLCVAEDNEANMASNALALLAATEVLRHAPYPAAQRMVDEIAKFIQVMQRDDGELKHIFDLNRNQAQDVQLLYASGEAAYALLSAYRLSALQSSAHRLSVERRQSLENYRRTAIAVMRHLTGAGWSFLGSRYYYGEEHWTCQAVALADALERQAAGLDFCRRWANFNAHVQYRQGETLWPIAGSYGASPLLLPRITPVASRTEAHIAIYRALKARGIEDRALRRQIEASLAMLLRYQWLPGPTFALADARRAHGAIPGSPEELEVRMDFVQHAGSAFLGWLEVLDQEKALAAKG